MARFRYRRSYWVLLIAVVVCAVVLAVPATRKKLFVSAGEWLVVAPEQVQSADVIVVAMDASGAGTLYAADLVHHGVAKRVAVFSDPPDVTDMEFLRRGLPYENRATLSTQQLNMMGIETVEQIPRKPSGSEEEGGVLPEWAKQQGYHRVILVSLTDHSHRLSRILRRATDGTQTVFTVVATPYSPYRAEEWWYSRQGTRTWIVETQKLLLDVIRHPFS